jgi:hypothetical protein
MKELLVKTQESMSGEKRPLNIVTVGHQSVSGLVKGRERWVPDR